MAPKYAILELYLHTISEAKKSIKNRSSWLGEAALPQAHCYHPEVEVILLGPQLQHCPSPLRFAHLDVHLQPVADLVAPDFGFVRENWMERVGELRNLLNRKGSTLFFLLDQVFLLEAFEAEVYRELGEKALQMAIHEFHIPILNNDPMLISLLE